MVEPNTDCPYVCVCVFLEQPKVYGCEDTPAAAAFTKLNVPCEGSDPQQMSVLLMRWGPHVESQIEWFQNQKLLTEILKASDKTASQCVSANHLDSNGIIAVLCCQKSTLLIPALSQLSVIITNTTSLSLVPHSNTFGFSGEQASRSIYLRNKW